MRIISPFLLFLFSLLSFTTLTHKTTTVTIIKPTTTISFTEFLLPTNHYQAVLQTGPLHTCFQTISAEKNWFAVAWDSGKFLDTPRCDIFHKRMTNQVGRDLSHWRCFWYFDSRTGTGVTKVEGELKSQVGKMENIVEKVVESIWGKEGVEQCRSI